MSTAPDGSALLAVLAALGAAAIIAFATAVQQRSTREAPPGRGLQVGMLAALARDPRWLASLGGVGLGFGLYLFALSQGAISLAQPVMVSGVVLGSVFAARLARRPVDRGLLLGGGLTAVGLAVLLGVARPSSGRYGFGPETDPVAVGWLAAVLGIVLVGALVVAVLATGLVRAIMLALAAGVLFGVNAALAKVVTEQLATGWTEPARYWALYAMIVAAPAGFVLSQRALQLGRLLAPVNVIISTADPVVAVAIGVVAFGERMVVTPTAVAAEMLAGIAVVAGILVVTRRGTRLLNAEEAVCAGASGGRAPVGWG